MSLIDKHAILEKNATLLLVGSLLVVGAVSGLAPALLLARLRPTQALRNEG